MIEQIAEFTIINYYSFVLQIGIMYRVVAPIVGHSFLLLSKTKTKERPTIDMCPSIGATTLLPYTYTYGVILS